MWTPFLIYDPLNEKWKRSVDGDELCELTITEEDAMEIIGSYVRIDLEWKPVSEFFMN